MALDWWDRVLYFASQNETNLVLCGGKTRLFRSGLSEQACLSRPNTKYPPRQSRRAIDNDGAIPWGPMHTTLAMELHYRLSGVCGYRSISGWTMVAFQVASTDAVADKRRVPRR